MKILYSAGARIGADKQLIKLLENLPNDCIIKICSYLNSSKLLSKVDFLLDSIEKSVSIFSNCDNKKIVLPTSKQKNFSLLLEEVEAFDPDLIICDYEVILAKIAKILKKELWYCSPLELFKGINWEHKKRLTANLEIVRKKIVNRPDGERNIIYSPFGDISFRPLIKKNYEWVTPYHVKQEKNCDYKYNYMGVVDDDVRAQKISNIFKFLPNKIAFFSNLEKEHENIDYFSNVKNDLYKKVLYSCCKMFTTGDTNCVADAIYNNKNICIAPSLKDPEALINSILVKENSIGVNLGQIELMNSFALNELNEALDKQNRNNFLSKQNNPYLHERIASW